MTLRCLFVDFNSFFASVEQHDNEALRGRPLAVVPVVAATTCCIAASIEAKRDHGIGTGTPVWEAMERCPDIVLVEARPARYVEIHHELMAAIDDCIPKGHAESIDEVPCYLIGSERKRENAEAIARRIKQTLIDRGYPTIRCSIGIAPNRFLAKTASDMVKPDGLTVLEQVDLPHALHGLELRDFCGIGPAMEHRLRAAGIDTVEQLCGATREHLRAAWGGIEGERYWLQLRGFDVPERATRRGSVGHSHVLGPELRTFEGARAVLFKLLAKAAMRLRNDRFLAGGLSIRIRFVGLEKRFERDLAFAPIDDTPALLRLLAEQLSQLEGAITRRRWNPRRNPPLSVAVTLVGLEPIGNVTDELMADRRRDRSMSRVVDSINRKYGNNAVYFGAMQQAMAHDAAPMRIPFSKIPETALEQDVQPRKRGGAQSAEAMDELYLRRERQYKVLAETAHREARKRKAPGTGEPQPFKAGAGGWNTTGKRKPEPEIGETRPLF
ncbi:DNA polymerase-4 [Luteimonas cucumeris]|uniref:DNA polymerase-4 n=1 Tax=Luteimonas cucumeris TaxID=985012 RepID=A0A562LEY5_9GAMM|nr:DNA polymerase [Luteimonas cucumeris]TWI06171.1 DNA polymerase-4 [Luteimonas cucumeris]